MAAADAAEVAVPAENPVNGSRPRRPRLWPPVALVGAYWIGWLVVQAIYKATFTQFLYLFWAPIVLLLAMLAWWLVFSRLRWIDRLWGVGCLALGAALAMALGDKSVAVRPMPMPLLMFALPVALSVMTLVLVVSRGSSTLPAWLALLAASLASWGYFTLIRIDGIDGNLTAERSWRWEPTSEEQYLRELVSTVSVKPQGPSAAADSGQAVPAAASGQPIELPTVAAESDWPEFRGRARDGAVRGVKIDPDWKANPPRLVWKRRVGPGWSSFATVGGYAFTQEQRGEEEAVVCLDIATGQEIWAHTDASRFWEVVAGAGPRATPTYSGGKVYTQGGNGQVNCLDAATGQAIWTRNAMADAGVEKPPMWGYSSSPLVTHGLAIVFAGGGKEGQGLVAYDESTGEPRWLAGKAEHSYSSPQLVAIEGVEQVLYVSDRGLESFDPQTGKLLWEHEWLLEGMFRVCQPHIVDEGQFLISTGMNGGTRQLMVTRDGEVWKVTEGWTSPDLKPYFNDFVRHDGFLYGFDGQIFSCLNAKSGKKQWQKGRYGHGQVLLIADQGLLLVLSEKEGDLILLEANPKKLLERARLPALAGKTWNHPVITGNRLLVRNDAEMACFELAALKE